MIYRRKSLLWYSLFSAAALLFFCEYLVYYLVLWNCSYPALPGGRQSDIADEPLYAMFLADTHLLGSRLGHPWDKLRREWQMHRAFQTAQILFRPELVVFLGDLFDEGKWCSENEFKSYLNRFHSLFSVDSRRTDVRVVVGNHDIGFHYAVTPGLKNRFEEAFGVKSVDRFSVKGINFVTVNSMAMEGDGCAMCAEGRELLKNVAKQLRCMQGDDSICIMDYDFLGARGTYSKPILLQHFPLYRESDAHCDEKDEAPAEEKEAPFRVGMDCLLREASRELLETIKPRLVLSGHTHHGCKTKHTFAGSEEVIEWSVSSFSWRNRNNPTFLLAKIIPEDISIEKCFLPEEDTIIQIYFIAGLLFVVFLLKNLFRC